MMVDRLGRMADGVESQARFQQGTVGIEVNRFLGENLGVHCSWAERCSWANPDVGLGVIEPMVAPLIRCWKTPACRGPDWLFGGFTGEPAGGLGLGPGPDPLGGEGGLRSSLFAGLGGPSRPFPCGSAANPATNTDRTSKALKPVTNCTRCMLNSFKN